MRRSTWVGLAMLLPTILLLGTFCYVPFVSALRMSLERNDGLGPAQFVGLENFRDLARDGAFRYSLFVLCILVGIGTLLATVFPLLAAKAISNVTSEWARYAYRVIFTIPMIVPGIVTLLVWKNLYATDGAINRLLELVGLASLAGSWLGDPSRVLMAILFIGFPWASGVGLLIYLAGFDGIDQSLYEAAELDGVGPVGLFLEIEVPLLRPHVRLISLNALLAGIQSYEAVLVLTDGGPGNRSLLPALHLFHHAFQFQQLGYAAAIGVVLFVVSLSLTIVTMRLLRNTVEA